MLSGEKQLDTIEPTTLQRWEQASTSLASALSHFFELSTLMEKYYTTRDAGSSNLVARIDSSLQYLGSTLNQQLIHSRVALAKTRNRLASPILWLPRETLASIFLEVMYDPKFEKPPFSDLGVMFMEGHVVTIYRRLHSLLGVCALWRNVGLTCSALWSVVPLGNFQTPFPLNLSTEISLERAGQRGLYLATTLIRDSDSVAFHSLAEHIPRFSAINIHETSGANVSMDLALRILLNHSSPGAVSSLSLARTGMVGILDGEDPSPPLNDFFGSFGPQFSNHVQSLSALRLRGVALDWRNTSLINLVVLRIANISLGRQVGIDAFISALSSATELRDLALVSIRAAPDENPNLSPHALVLPKLESVYLEDLWYNLFNLFVKALAPGPFHLTVNLFADFPQSYFMSEIFRAPYLTFMKGEDISNMLAQVKIDILILNRGDGCTWESPTDLWNLLRSLPATKTLVLNNLELNQDLLKALLPPHGQLAIPFPKIEGLEFQCTAIHMPLGDLRHGFEDLLVGHPLKQITLGRNYPDYGDPELGDDDEVLQWLGAKVPRFRWFTNQWNPAELSCEWQLWDV